MTPTPLIRALAAATLLSGALPALAQTSPYYVGVSQRLTHQSNVFQTDTAAVSDTLSTTSLLAGLDQPFGRQRLFGTLTASANRYQDNSALNNESYALRAGLDWSTIERLSGTVSANLSQQLGDFSPAGLPGTTSRNLVRNQGLTAVARLGVVTRLTTEASLGHRSTRYSNALFESRETDVNEGSLGVKYRLGGSSGVGAALRLTRGEYPRYLQVLPGQYLAETYRRKNLDLTGDWAPSGASRLNARVSLGRDEYASDSVRNFSGVTGSLGWNWQPTGRISVSTTLSRDTGDEATFREATAQTAAINSSVNRVRNGLSVGASYALSAKIGLRANANTSTGTVVDPATDATASEKSSTFGLGVTWNPTRSIRTGCDFSRNTRSASALASAYDANVFGCFGEFTLR